MATVFKTIARDKSEAQLTQYEGGDISWFDLVVANQTEIMQKAGLADSYKDYLVDKLALMKTKKCAVCNLNGHISSYCWLNSQMFSECRGSAEGIEAWTCYRQGMKLTKTFNKMEMLLKIKKAVAMKTNPLVLKGILLNAGIIN